MHDLIASPFGGGYLVTRPGQPQGLKVSRSKYLELSTAKVFPSWLVNAACKAWDLDLFEVGTSGRLLVRPEVVYPFGKATYELNLGCNYDCEHCSVNCTLMRRLGLMPGCGVVEVCVTKDLYRDLSEGMAVLPRVGSVQELPGRFPPYAVLDADGAQVEPVSAYLKDLALSDNGRLTCRSYAYDLLRWFRLLWFLTVSWDSATEAEAAAMVGMLRTADNPQRRRRTADAPPPGSVNIRTGKSYLRAGYAPTTINHALTVVSGFYDFHRHHGRGPLANPVPVSEDRRRALAHHNPMWATPQHRRGRLRQQSRRRQPRAIPDGMWDELFASMAHVRDRAALQLYVSSGSRASELLGVTLGDIDWSRQQIYVVSKGTRLREPVPVSQQALLLLAAYLEETGLPAEGEPVLRTRRGADRPLTYWAIRRVLQRANDRLGTNWTLHDLRHTAAERMANDPHLTLAEVRVILRHSSLAATGIYLNAQVDDLFDKLQEHYNRPRVKRALAPGYDPEDMKAVFGG